MRGPNASPSAKCQPTISAQAEQMLDRLAKLGIYGRTKNEVAGRFIEQVLQRLVETPRLPVPPASPPPSGHEEPIQPKVAPRRRKREQD